ACRPETGGSEGRDAVLRAALYAAALALLIAAGLVFTERQA
ncbi:hypothetical protein ACLBQW_22115, partial [Klebsiella pneumoniae]